MPASDSALSRSFLDLPKKDHAETQDYEFLYGLMPSGDLTWDQLLEADRVLIVSEAGAGKTYECKAQQERLFAQGESAFYLELASLANSTPEAQLKPAQRQRLESWRSAQNERAVFFLDSIDELRLTPHSFALTLRQFANALGDNLDRACIVLTTRPGTDDRAIVENELPLRQVVRVIEAEEAFADVAMRVELPKDAVASAMPRSRFVALAPLNEVQMRALAHLEGVGDPDELLKAIEAAHAQEFSKRPLDFIELCADWKAYGRIRGHRDQLESSIAVKLRPRARSERDEPADLQPDKAREGAERLALAALMTRNFTLWHDAETGRGHGADALDPQSVLTDWTAAEIQTLLERPLFGFASYGRVRFHNRSAIEYLAACRLLGLMKRGLRMRTLQRLLFVTSPVGLKLVRPTMQPVAAWLAPQLDPIRNEVLQRDPSILLRFGDPGALQPGMRVQALELYAQRYGSGGWRGMHVPALQARRLASPELAPTIRKLWDAGIENDEVRETLLDLIETGRIHACADIAFDVAVDVTRNVRERLDGLKGLAATDDPRLTGLLDQIASQHAGWPPDLAKLSILYLFPAKMTLVQMLGALRALKYRRFEAGGISSFLPDAITRAELAPGDLEWLRHGLTQYVAADCAWDPGNYRIRTSRHDLVGPLMRVCELQIQDRAADGPLAESVALVLQLSRDDDFANGDTLRMRGLLATARPSLRAAVFWAQETLLSSKMIGKDADDRLVRILWAPSLALDLALDQAWMEASLRDSASPPERRRLVLDCFIQTLRGTASALSALKALRPMVSDTLALTAHLYEAVGHIKNPRPLPQWAQESQKKKRERERKQLKDRASWKLFFRELNDAQGQPISADRAANSAINLVEVMSRVRDDNQHIGWNRGFLERMFPDKVAQLRQLLIDQWRKVEPTLPSERPEEQRNWYYKSWWVGVIGLYAEAEDPDWARRLTKAEAQLAMRYAITAMNGLPAWVGALAQAHPEVVRDMLAPELEAQLNDTGEQSTHSSLLQYIEHSGPGVIALFVDTIRGWLSAALASGASLHGSNKFERAIDLLLIHGAPGEAASIVAAAQAFIARGLDQQGLLFWLPLLLRLAPRQAVDEMERLAAPVTPAFMSIVTDWLGVMFGHHSRGEAVTTELLADPELLYRMVLLAYRHIRVADDREHDGPRRSDSRSNAEFARSRLVQLLFESKGAAAWEYKLKFAQDPLAAHFKERATALAEQAMAQEWDAPLYRLSDVAALESIHDMAPVTRADMAALLLDRLGELDDRLRQDSTPRQLWARLREETELRRLVAAELEHLANGAYNLSQEQVTGEEKETDVRLRSSGYPIEAVIELKVGDKDYSVADLRKALRDQLVGRYMVPEARRVGCLMISLASSRQWKHPEDGHLIDVEEVIALLQVDADDIAARLGFESLLVVRLLDLRPVVLP